jgi:transposase-like protein
VKRVVVVDADPAQGLVLGLVDAEHIRTSGKSIPQICRELDLTETSVRRWVARAEIDASERPGLTSDERQELARLRKENRILRSLRSRLGRGLVRR